jgi:hypothetical protein
VIPSVKKTRRLTSVVAVSALLSGLFLVGADTSSASESIESFSVSSSTTAAGGHPDLGGLLSVDNLGSPDAARRVTIDEPEGLFGNPHAITICSSSDFALTQCPTTSQAGVVTIRAKYENSSSYLLGTAPLFDVQTQSEDETARFAFIAPTVNIPISIPVTVRTGSDYGLRLAVTGISQQIPLEAFEFMLWGYPYSSSHDAERFLKGSPGAPAGCPGKANALCASLGGADPHGAGVEPTPLTDNPTICTGAPLAATAEVETYQDPSHPTHASAQYPATTECEAETFKPVAGISLTTNETDSPSGLNLQLKAPQFEGLTASPSEIRSATIVLPDGLTINPDAADGQRACTDAQANFGSDAPSSCPDNSKIGNFDIVTPALDGPLGGSLYIGEPKPGNQYRVFMIADGFGIHAKLAASMLPDPQTGQLTFTTTNLPQVPFETFNIHLFASDRGLVATPTHCSLYGADATFIPWNQSLPLQVSRSNMSLSAGPNGLSCPGMVRPFEPRLVAGMSTPAAGAFSTFTLRLDRDDGDQFLRDVNFKMPPGFTGSLRGIAYCPEAAIIASAQKLGKEEQVSPSCPASSQVGTTNVAAGPGSHPFHAVGKMYLAGPFKGAPLSLVAITPALAGPYDYGVVVVRVALHVDPLSAQVNAVSDTVPSIVGGVPIRMRSIQVSIDRPNFTINPTNCSPLSIDSQGIGDQGTVTNFSSYFHAVNCASLPFKPKMSFKQLGGRKQTKRSKDPSLQIDLNTRPGNANLKSVTVTLPSAFEIDQNHLGNLCAKAQLEAERCQGRQPIGEVETETPLLAQPLKGPAYAVSGYGKLPHLAFILDGQVMLIPQAESFTVKGRLRTIVPVIPDAPIGHFRFILFGKSQGYLANTKNLCNGQVRVQVDYMAQNGKTAHQRPKVKTACPKSRKAKRTQQRHHRARG